MDTVILSATMASVIEPLGKDNELPTIKLVMFAWAMVVELIVVVVKVVVPVKLFTPVKV